LIIIITCIYKIGYQTGFKKGKKEIQKKQYLKGYNEGYKKVKSEFLKMLKLDNGELMKRINQIRQENKMN